MKDLTTDSIAGHILTMAVPVALTMLVLIAQQMIDLYFVVRLGAASTAGVNAAGNIAFVVTAMIQVLSVGTVSLVAQAAGRKDRADANIVFNQAVALSAGLGAATGMLLYPVAHPYLHWIAADEPTLAAGKTFVLWSLPGYALTLPMAAFSGALRGIGIVRPAFWIYSLTILLNALLAPVLIAGWGTGAAFGVAGAGLATSLSSAVGVALIIGYVARGQPYLVLDFRSMYPRRAEWCRILRIGLPAGGEFVLTFAVAAVAYYALRGFGAAAQAGFGIGSRILQLLLLPGVSIALAAGPIAGQNFGAGNYDRVRATFRQATLLATVALLTVTVLVQWRPMAFVSVFDSDPSAAAVAASFLQLVSWTLVAQGLAQTCKTMFVGLGNTVPSLISSVAYLVAFTVPAVWLSTQAPFRMELVWYLLIVAIVLRTALSVWLLRAEFRRRLPGTQLVVESGIVR